MGLKNVVDLQKKVLGSSPNWGRAYVEFACSPCVRVGLLWFTPPSKTCVSFIAS